jgi:hypothetical protein
VQLPNDRLMPPMQSIEIADGHRTAVVVGLQIVKSSYQSHQAG